MSADGQALATATAERFAIGYADIVQAAKTIAGQVLRTPTLFSQKLSDLTGAEVFVKYDNLQTTSSFKERGALNKLLSLGHEERRRGVVTMSAGNHAQALAYHARRLGVPATIVMPERTPYVKISNTEAFGARVVLGGETLAESATLALALGEEHNFVLVHPYDDAAVMAGQGTHGLEIAEDVPRIDCAVIPIGGGGLIAGSAIALKQMQPNVEIIGAETELFPSMKCILAGEPMRFGKQSLAEGIAVKVPGVLAMPIVRALVSDIVLIDEPTIERAISLLLTAQRTLAEGAGAAGLAAMLTQPERFRGRRVVLTVCGGNIDMRVAASIMMRGLERDDKIISLRFLIDDTPGVLGRVSTIIGDHGANILEVSHRRSFLDVPAKGATLDVTIETKDGPHAARTFAAIEAEGFTVIRLLSPTSGLAM